MDKLLYHRHRYPSIVIQQAIWLYFRFALIAGVLLAVTCGEAARLMP